MPSVRSLPEATQKAKTFKASLTLIEAFGKMSGLKLNDRKTEALWIGSKTNCQQKFCLGKNFQWQNKKAKALGVWFSTDQGMVISLNYTEKLTKIKSILGCWKFQRLSLVGKIVVLKSLVSSQLVYVFSPLQTNHEVIKEINKLFSIFYGTIKVIKLNAWSDTFFEGKTVSKDHLLSLPLWQNY